MNFFKAASNLLAVVACALSANGAHVAFDLSEFNTAPISRRVLYITPESTPTTNGTVIITSDSRRFFTDTSGQVTVSNVVAGTYQVALFGPQTNTVFDIQVPDTNIVLDAWSLLTTNSIPAATAAYTQSQANGRFRRLEDTWSITFADSLTLSAATMHYILELPGDRVTVRVPSPTNHSTTINGIAAGRPYFIWPNDDTTFTLTNNAEGSSGGLFERSGNSGVQTNNLVMSSNAVMLLPIVAQNNWYVLELDKRAEGAGGGGGTPSGADNSFQIKNGSSFASATNILYDTATGAIVVTNQSGDAVFRVTDGAVTLEATTNSIGTTTAHDLYLKVLDIAAWQISATGGPLLPGADSTYDIGSPTNRPANVYADTFDGLTARSGIVIASNNFILPKTTADPSSDGLKLDTNGAPAPVIKFYYNGEVFYVVATTNAPGNDQIPKYDSATGRWRHEADAGGGAGLTDLNGLTADPQTFAVGTAGSDFAISSVTDVHTFNLPTASATNRGALLAADWVIFHAKQPTNELLTEISGLAGNGLIAQTGAETVANRTITGDAEIVVNDGDGVSGNPTLSIAAGLTRDSELAITNAYLTTNGGSMFGTFNLTNVTELLMPMVDGAPSSEGELLMDTNTAQGALLSYWFGGVQFYLVATTNLGSDDEIAKVNAGLLGFEADGGAGGSDRVLTNAGTAFDLTLREQIIVPIIGLHDEGSSVYRLDGNLGNNFQTNITGNVTINLTNVNSDQTISLQVDSDGAHTVNFSLADGSWLLNGDDEPVAKSTGTTLYKFWRDANGTNAVSSEDGIGQLVVSTNTVAGTVATATNLLLSASGGLSILATNASGVVSAHFDASGVTGTGDGLFNVMTSSVPGDVGVGITNIRFDSGTYSIVRGTNISDTNIIYIDVDFATLEAAIDHGSIAGLTDDDHPLYALESESLYGNIMTNATRMGLETNFNLVAGTNIFLMATNVTGTNMIAIHVTTAPEFTDFSSATHDHSDVAGGGTIAYADITGTPDLTITNAYLTTNGGSMFGTFNLTNVTELLMPMVDGAPSSEGELLMDTNTTQGALLSYWFGGVQFYVVATTNLGADNEIAKVNAGLLGFEADGGSGGDDVSVNGTAATNADLDDATPAAPAGGINVAWQKDTTAPDNISAHLLFEGNHFDLSSGEVSIKNRAFVTNLSAFTSFVLTNATASRVAIINAANQVTNSTVTDTELGHLSGVTSALQTQLDGKEPGDADLTALAGSSGTGYSVRSATDTWVFRSITEIGNASTIANGNGVSGNTQISFDEEIEALADLEVVGLVTRSADNTLVSRTISESTTTLGITDGDGAAGNPTFTVDGEVESLAALEANGMLARSADDTLINRTITEGAGIDVANGDGVSGNPTITLEDRYAYEYFNAAAFLTNTVEGATYGTVEEADIGVTYDYLGFADAVTNTATIAWVAPEDWDRGTVKFKVHWSSTVASGGVVWELAAVAVGNDDPLNATMGTVQTATDTQTAASDLLLSPATASLTVGGTPAAGDVVYIRIRRRTNDASDTLAGEARMHNLWIQYVRSGTEASAW